MSFSPILKVFSKVLIAFFGQLELQILNLNNIDLTIIFRNSIFNAMDLILNKVRSIRLGRIVFRKSADNSRKKAFCVTPFQIRKTFSIEIFSYPL